MPQRLPRIAVIGSNIPRPGEILGGGAQRFAIELTQALAARNDLRVEMLVRTRDGRLSLGTTSREPYKIYRGPVAPLAWRLSGRFDLLHFLQVPPSLALGEILPVWRHVLRRPCVYSMNDLGRRPRPKPLPRWMLAVEERLLYGSDRVVSCSPLLREKAIDAYGASLARIECIPYGIDHTLPSSSGSQDEIHRRLHVTPGVPLVFGLGGTARIKGLRWAAKALAREASGLPPFCFRLAGPPGDDHEGVLSALRGMTDARYVGLLGPEDVAAALSVADLYFHPSRQESFALAVTEALMVDTPVLLSDQVGLLSLLPGGTRDLPSFRMGDPSDLRHTLGKTLADLAGARIQARHAAEFLRQFTWARAAESYATLYRECLGRRPGPSWTLTGTGRAT